MAEVDLQISKTQKIIELQEKCKNTVREKSESLQNQINSPLYSPNSLEKQTLVMLEAQKQKLLVE